MALMCSLVTLEVNGQEITNFKSFTENEVEGRSPVKLMNTTAFRRMTKRYGCKVEYVHPEDGKPPFDFDSVENGVLTAVREDGVRITYNGVYCLKVGEAKSDGENEKSSEIEFGATSKSVS
jgi:hypothetical protein